MYDGVNKYYRGLPREVGRTIATGDIISYIDTDDYLLENAVLILKKAWETTLKHNPNTTFITNTEWYDNILALEYPLLYNQVTKTLPDIKIKGLPSSWYNVVLKEGHLVVGPPFQSHKAEMPVKWKDTGGDTGIPYSEDKLFIDSAMQNPLVIIEATRSPVYVRCHLANKWDY